MDILEIEDLEGTQSQQMVVQIRSLRRLGFGKTPTGADHARLDRELERDAIGGSGWERGNLEQADGVQNAQVCCFRPLSQSLKIRILRKVVRQVTLPSSPPSTPKLV